MATIKITDGNVLGLTPGEYEQTTDADGTIHIKPVKPKVGHGYNILEHGQTYWTGNIHNMVTEDTWDCLPTDRNYASVGQVFLDREDAEKYFANPELAEYETLRTKMFAAYHECLAAHGLSEWRWKWGHAFYYMRGNMECDYFSGYEAEVTNPFKFPKDSDAGGFYACHDFIARVKHDWQRWCELSTGR